MPQNPLVKHWPTLALIVTVILGYFVSIYFTHNMIVQQTNVLNTKIDGVNAKLSETMASIDRRTAKLEAAVKALGDNQTNPLKGLVHDLLAAATNALPKKPEVAARAISAADSLIVTLKKEKRAADPEYFRQMVSTINDLNDRIGVAKSAGETHLPDLKAAVYTTKISLAEYRSALEPTPPIASISWMTFSPNLEFGIGFSGNNTYDQVSFDFSPLGQRIAIRLMPPLKGLLSENNVIKNAYIKAGYIVLDGIHWNNVVFMGSHIIYRGGEVELRNVRFPNCTFEVVPTDRGEKLVNYAALASQYLIVPG